MSKNLYKVAVVARREYLANVRTKGFLVSLLLVPILGAGGAIAQNLLRGRVDLEDKRILVADGTGQILSTLQRAANEREIFDRKTGRQVEPRFTVLEHPRRTLDDDERLALSGRVRSREIHVFVEIDATLVTGTGGARLYSESANTGNIARWLNRELASAVQRLRLQEQGIDPALVARALAPVSVEALGLYTRTDAGDVRKGGKGGRAAASAMPFVLMLLMFMAIMMSQTLLQSALEEKQQRIAEVLLGSVPPFPLMLGKLLGGVGVALTTVSVYLVGGALMLRRLGLEHLLRSDLIGWFLAFLVLGVICYGSLFAAVGAACSELKDAQSYLMPVMLVLVLPMMIWFKVMEEPMSRFSTAVSFLPPFTPMLMPLRLAASEAVPLWQPLLGFALTLLMALATVWAAGRVFRVGLLLQGRPPRLRQLLEWVLRG